MKPFRLDICVYPTRFLLCPGSLAALRKLIADRLPKWSNGLHLEGDTAGPIAIDDPEGFDTNICVAIEAGGYLYKRLSMGKDVLGKCRGTLELGGTNNSVSIILGVDERPIRRQGLSWAFGSSIVIQVCSGTVEGEPAEEWAKGTFELAVSSLDVQYAYACMSEEYEAKNISSEGGGMMAVGRDILRYIPGLYWLNFFGKRYCELIGKKRLLEAPATATTAIGGGVLVRVVDDPLVWNGEERTQMEAAVLDFVGHQFFFSRSDPERTTLAPDFLSE